MKSQTILLIGCLSLSHAAFADETATSQPTSDPVPVNDPELKPPPSKKPLVKYKPNDGFVFTFSEDFKLRIDATAQLQLTTDDDVVEANGSFFDPRRLKLSARGKIGDATKFKLSVDFASIININADSDLDEFDDPDFVQDMWVERELKGNLLYVQAGYFRPSFGRQRLNAPESLLLLHRSQVTHKFGFERGLGVAVGGELKKKSFEYEAGFTVDFVSANQLSESLGTEVGPIPVFAARIVSNPFGPLQSSEAPLKIAKYPHLSFGADFAIPFQSEDTFKNDSGNPSFGLDTAFEFDRFSGLAELMFRARQVETPILCQAGDATCDGVQELDGSGTINAGDAIGVTVTDQTAVQAAAFAQVGFLVVPKRFQIAGRAGIINQDNDFSDNNKDGIFSTQGTKVELSLGANLYLEERRLVVQGMFSNTTETDDVELNPHTFRLQLQGAL
jgi:hypothetical protein